MLTFRAVQKLNVEFDPEEFNGSGSPPGQQSSKAVYDVAQHYSMLWNKGALLAPSVRTVHVAQSQPSYWAQGATSLAIWSAIRGLTSCHKARLSA